MLTVNDKVLESSTKCIVNVVSLSNTMEEVSIFICLVLTLSKVNEIFSWESAVIEVILPSNTE